MAGRARNVRATAAVKNTFRIIFSPVDIDGAQKWAAAVQEGVSRARVTATTGRTGWTLTRRRRGMGRPNHRLPWQRAPERPHAYDSDRRILLWNCLCG